MVQPKWDGHAQQWDRRCIHRSPQLKQHHLPVLRPLDPSCHLEKWQQPSDQIGLACASPRNSYRACIQHHVYGLRQVITSHLEHECCHLAAQIQMLWFLCPTLLKHSPGRHSTTCQEDERLPLEGLLQCLDHQNRLKQGS